MQGDSFDFDWDVIADELVDQINWIDNDLTSSAIDHSNFESAHCITPAVESTVSNHSTSEVDHSTQTVMANNVEMTDQELSNLNIKELNRMLKERCLSKDMIARMKLRRRTLKNRKYATDCREKKDVEVHQLEDTKDFESTDISTVYLENERLHASVARLKVRYAKLMAYARRHNIPIKDNHLDYLDHADASVAAAASAAVASSSNVRASAAEQSACDQSSTASCGSTTADESSVDCYSEIDSCATLDGKNDANEAKRASAGNNDNEDDRGQA